MSGITDEVAIEGHDLIHYAEVAELKRHPDNDWALAQDVWVEDSGTQTPDKKLEGEQKESKMSKIKQALKMDK